MQPQIVSDLTGINAKDLEGTIARLTKGNSWKKQRIIVVLPSSDTIAAKVALSHWNMIFPPNNGVVRLLALGQEVGKAYTNTIEGILQHPELSKWEYILTIEHDNIPPQDGILKLLEKLEERKDLHAVSGLYFTKGIGGVAQIWGDIKDPMVNFRPQIPIPGQLIECYGIGMGFALWRLDTFKNPELIKPLFETKAQVGAVGTQDLVFWSNNRKFGLKCAVDCSVLVGHYDLENDIVW